MWNAIAAVSSGLTLVAFLAAAAVWIYRQRLVQTERLIRSVPEGQRAGLVERVIESVHVDTGNLTREQRYQLSLKLIHARSRRFTLSATIVLCIAVIAAGLAAFAMHKESNHEVKPPAAFGPPFPFNTGWIFLGYYDRANKSYVEGPFARIVYRPAGKFNVNETPAVGDILQVDKVRRVIVPKFKSEGVKHQLESLPGTITDADETGVELDKGALVVVRDAQVRGFAGRNPAVWCRVAACDEDSAQCREALKALK